MKTKSYLLGFCEGLIVAFLVVLVERFMKNGFPNILGYEASADITLVVLTSVVFSAMLLITNNVRKTVFGEMVVPRQERVIECIGGISSLAVLVLLFLFIAR